MNKLKKVMPELERLRSKELQFEYESKRVRNLSTDLVKVEAELSSAKNQISRLEFKLKPYEEKEAAEEVEKARIQREIEQRQKVERALARPGRRESLDYS